MLRAYVEAGFDPGTFWGLTPRLYLAHMRGAAQRFEREGRSSAELAWMTATLSRAEKIPPLAKLLRGKPEKMSPDELRVRLKALSKALPKITQEEWRARFPS
ncbi:hypothetical protein [Palleronia sp. LCG004]|uniref:hypothetical protein n=1 Tax=Palleronia sp. LCG004 TaxID=3079304 RepID=UPI0029432BF8|nr:hypothetical protein [Palleronia sp. LCG004]WOI54956.1 hypothetical protein RVY76_07715 [Palleronia sp. LCG004]